MDNHPCLYSSFDLAEEALQLVRAVGIAVAEVGDGSL